MGKSSSGVLIYRISGGRPEVLLVHPGGPFWARKDTGAWSVPKGEVNDGEDLLAAGRRELAEETGARPDGPFQPLGSIKQKGGKIVHAWAVEGDLDATAVQSNTFSMEWPPRSGKMREFPEVSEAAWFGLTEARVKILPSQEPLLDRLVELLGE
ncbi:MAG TPA: NUDIX domain-containing protein [Thermoanaerobaculia bacterium]|jgi:predicted NUDIX family NTP pyrophosphohydrolase|nr:NUDIX domain-containing protein [Thermoanaerobaculia bacterium]